MRHLLKVKPWHLALLNVLGVLLSFFYGIVGGSGGETTEGVFMGIYLTGMVSIVLCLLFLTVNAFLGRITWTAVLVMVAIMAVSYMETTIYTPR